MAKAPTVRDEPNPESTEVQQSTMQPPQPAGGPTPASPPTPTPRANGQLSVGERAVGLTFNPSGDPLVTELKQLYAKIIDVCYREREKVNAGRITAAPQQHEAARLWSIAITEAQGAQMWSVKAATWKD